MGPFSFRGGFSSKTTCSLQLRVRCRHANVSDENTNRSNRRPIHLVLCGAAARDMSWDAQVKSALKVVKTSFFNHARVDNGGL